MDAAKLPDYHDTSDNYSSYPDDWLTLRLFLGYRIFLAAVLILVYFGIGRGPLGSHAPLLFEWTAQAYLALTLLFLMLALTQQRQRHALAHLAVFSDILFITLMMHASGGVQSGIGMLMAVSIALGSMSIHGRTALLHAALASLAVLTEQVFADITNTFSTSAYMHAGLLGTSFFALAILADRLVLRARHSEQLASQRGLDLANLAQVNDFVIRHMQAGIVVVDGQQIIQVMNETAWALLGMPDAARHYPLEQSSPELARQFDEWLSSPISERKPFRVTGSGRDLRASFTRLGNEQQLDTLIVLEDTATLTAQLQQMKLASLGRLTAGIAHEIRNPLGAISHAAQLLDESPDLVETDSRMAQIIQQNSRRVNEVVESVLKLSRQDNPHPKPLVLAPWLAPLVNELRHTYHLDEQQLTLQISPEGTTVFADPGQLRQIIDVLCDNAIRHFERAHEELRLHIQAGITLESGGPYLECQDNGKGIAREDAAQLFEPFFTTRNEGTGLGLYIARQLSEANRIRIEYLPQPTGGSCFRLSFPNPKRPELKL